MHRNDIDKKLLYKNPHSLVESYQHVIRSIVQRFINAGMLSAHEREDVIQHVNEKLLTDKIKRMQKLYDQSYFVFTYFSKIVYNICLDLVRSFRKENIIDRSVDISTISVFSDEPLVMDTLTIKEEIYRLETIFKLYRRGRYKLELFLKINSRVSISDTDVYNAFPESNESERTLFLTVLGGNSQYRQMIDQDIYKELTPLINRFERKNNTVEAIRKWIDSKINEIIGLLNSEPHNSTYDRETLKLLIQRYYE